MRLFIIILLKLLISASQNSWSQQKSIEVVYKKIDSVELKMEVIYPDNFDRSMNYPAMVFFFGGGWIEGTTEQFRPHALHFAEMGMICFLVDYRVQSRHNSMPFESLKDARSAIRFIRTNAQLFGIDARKIVGAGGSAGGHLAAAAALHSNFNEADDDLSISSRPDALVLFNPVLDNGPGGFGFEKVGDAYHSFSPFHNVKPDAPPCIIFLGTEDRVIPVATVRKFQAKMEKEGNRCELFLYEGQGHGFFNYRNKDYYLKTISEAENFLISLGYITD